MQKQTKPSVRVTERNTKTEILEAYQELLNQVTGEPEEDDTVKQEQILLETAAKETVEKITTDLSQLRLTTTQTISNLTERLTSEAERFATLQKAIAIAQKELMEMQQINARAGMLKRMIEIQKQEEARFEKEIAAVRQAWTEEQKAYEERIRRERIREEDEYTYEQKLKRKRDIDAWEEDRNQRVEALAKEKEALTVQMKELDELRKQVAQFSVQLEKAVKEATEKTLAQERKDAQIRANFAKQEADTRAQVAALKISLLEKTVREQSDEIAELKRQLEQATRQVKDIAVAVIEGPKRERDSETQTKPATQPTK